MPLIGVHLGTFVFLHLLVKLYLEMFHPDWELRSSFQTVHFKEACNLFASRIRRISLNCEE